MTSSAVRDIDDAVISRLATCQRLLVASDFDGVLAPIIDDPRRSAPLPTSLAALARLAAIEGTDVAIVSGRERRQLRALVPEPDRFTLVGSHGAEIDDVDPDPADLDLLARLVDELDRLAREIPGFFVESKTLSVAAHFRRIDDEQRRREATERVERLRRRWSAKVVSGKEVVEFTIATATKGDAVLVLAERGDRPTVVYLGDDLTDEDAFAVLGPGDVGIKVGPGPTSASHRVDTPDDVARFLGRLADLRTGPAGR